MFEGETLAFAKIEELAKQLEAKLAAGPVYKRGNGLTS